MASAQMVTVNDATEIEGTGLLFTVSLDVAASGPFTVTTGYIDVEATGGTDYDNNPQVLNFNGTAGETQQFTVTTTDDAIDENSETFTVTLNASDPLVTDSDLGTGTITDNDTAGVTITESGGSTDVTEGGATDTYSVVLDTQPTANVDITVDPDTQTNLGSGAGTAITLTFTGGGGGNWSTPQTVTVTAVDDSVDEASPHTSTITHGSSSTDSNYGPSLVISNVLANITDNDTLTFDTSTNVLTVPEGSTNTFTVVLSADPAGTVNATVARLSGDNDISVQSGGNLTFTGGTGGTWSTPQTVTLAAAEDSNAVNGTATIQVSDDGGVIPSENVTATEADNDSLNFVLSTNAVSVPEGGSNTFTVALSADPVSDVTASVTRLPGGDTDILASPVSLLFTAGATGDWNTPHTVTVAASEDDDAGNGTATIRVSDDGGVITAEDVTATEEDNESLNFVTNTDVVSVPEGGNNSTLQVRLSADPVSTVTVSIARVLGDTDISVSSGSRNLTFTGGAGGNWSFFQTVTIVAAEDDLDVINGEATIRINATGIQNKDVTATEVDNDSLNFITNPSSVTIPEGDTATFTVRLDKQPAASVNATVSRASGDTDISVQSGGTLTFDSINWDTPQTVTLAAAEDDLDLINGEAIIRISATGIQNKDVTATESDNETLNFVTDTDLVIVPEGGTATFNVQLNAEPETAVTVNISIIGTSDPDISVQPPSTFNLDSGNWNSGETITLAAAEDVDGLSDTANISISSADVPNKSITAQEADDDTITIETPNGGEVWIRGTTREIFWRTTSDVTTTVVIRLFKGGALEQTITTTDNDGSFIWDIPNNLLTDFNYRIRITDQQNTTISDDSDGDFSILDQSFDIDGDTIPNFEEMGPAGLDDRFDGNNDTIPDWDQGNVVSLSTFDRTLYVTFEADETITNMQPLPPPPDGPEGFSFPYGFFDFEIDLSAAGGSAIVTMILCPSGSDGQPVCDGEIPNTFWKFGATPDNFTPHFYEFTFDDVTQTGAEIDDLNLTVTLSFVDGLRGDDDLDDENGTISDPGAPAVVIPGISGEATGSDCFIATAAFGSPSAPYVKLLRKFRDNHLLTNRAGQWFVDRYYMHSPPAARWLAKHDAARALVRVLLTPLIVTAWILLSAPLALPLVAAVPLLGIFVRRARAGNGN